MKVSFEDSSIAFKGKSNKELNMAYFLFLAMNKPMLVKVLSSLTTCALKLHLPIQWLIKKTVYKQFCGGETKEEYENAIKILEQSGIGAILDYSVEGEESEEGFENTKNELLKIITYAKHNPNIPRTCMKLTGIMSDSLLQKISEDAILSTKENKAYEKSKVRFDVICQASKNSNIPLYIDAEESWIQKAIDELTEDMMLKYNKERVIVFTTIQMYRHDRNTYFEALIKKARNQNFKIGVKIVRGAYLEKENKRAKEMGYPSPINSTKEATDHEFNKAIETAVRNNDIVELCAGTHNENSCLILVELMNKLGISNDNKTIFFSQLYGMSDHISYSLANSGYNVSKYLPFGPVKSTIPYLIRRAQENTSIAGQMGQELAKLIEEKNRRKKLSKS